MKYSSFKRSGNIFDCYLGVIIIWLFLFVPSRIYLLEMSNQTALLRPFPEERIKVPSLTSPGWVSVQEQGCGWSKAILHVPCFRGGPHPYHFTVPSAGLIFTVQRRQTERTRRTLSRWGSVSAVWPTELLQQWCRTVDLGKTFCLAVLLLGVLAQVGFKI